MPDLPTMHGPIWQIFPVMALVHDTWFTERTELARKNQLIMRKLGMQPVLQGYSGMVLVDITSKDPSAEVIKQEPGVLSSGQVC